MKMKLSTRIWLAWQVFKSQPVSFNYDSGGKYSDPRLTVEFEDAKKFQLRLQRMESRDSRDYGITAVIGANEKEVGKVILGMADEVRLPAITHPTWDYESALGLDTLRVPGAVRIFSRWHDFTVEQVGMSEIRITAKPVRS